MLIMVINFFMVHGITTALDHGSAPLINEAGRMRMLSQRIRSIAYEIDNSIQVRTWNNLEPLHEDLVEALDDFNDIHSRIFDVNDSILSSKALTREDRDTLDAITVPFKQLTYAGSEFEMLTRNTIRRAPHLDTQTLSRINATKLDIRAAQAQFLPRMERLVAMLSERASSEVARGTSRARLGLFILAVMLAGMVLFVIEPTILIVRRQLLELDKATRVIRKADSVRWRLLTNMGHEFRTPMNAILGFSELLNDKSLTAPERERLAHSVHESAKQLGSLIETMLDMSSIESGQLRINPSDAKLRDIVEPCAQLAKPKAIAAGLDLSVNIDPSCDQAVVTEPKRLAQVVNKLIDNAIKFTPKGSVSIHASVETRDEDCVILISVTDSGIGIAPQQLNTIFDPFHQAENNLTRSFGGSGLGLAFARDLTHALGGDITVTSKVNQGSCFTIRIETKLAALRIETPTQETATGPTSLSEARVLIVDDAKDNRVLLQHFFKKTNANIEFAYDGQQAIEQVTNATNEKRPFHLILMDMQMPVLDGYAATAKLREMGIDTPVLALTAHALDGDRDKCIEAGCDDYLSKPVNRTTLLSKCNTLLGIEAEQNEANKQAA